jgi:hypothetical protein
VTETRIHGPGVTTDHHGVQIVAGPDDSIYRDDDGRIFVRRDDNPHALLRTVWTAAAGHDDLPDVRIVGVQLLSDETVELSIASVEFDADLRDEFGSRCAVRSIDLEGLLMHWRRADDEAQAEDTITSILQQLDRLG